MTTTAADPSSFCQFPSPSLVVPHTSSKCVATSFLPPFPSPTNAMQHMLKSFCELVLLLKHRFKV